MQPCEDSDTRLHGCKRFWTQIVTNVRRYLLRIFYRLLIQPDKISQCQEIRTSAWADIFADQLLWQQRAAIQLQKTGRQKQQQKKAGKKTKKKQKKTKKKQKMNRKKRQGKNQDLRKAWHLENGFRGLPKHYIRTSIQNIQADMCLMASGSTTAWKQQVWY